MSLRVSAWEQKDIPKMEEAATSAWIQMFDQLTPDWSYEKYAKLANLSSGDSPERGQWQSMVQKLKDPGKMISYEILSKHTKILQGKSGSINSHVRLKVRIRYENPRSKEFNLIFFPRRNWVLFDVSP